MGAFYDEISESLIEWIQQQHMFWVASAPLSPSGHVNVSPKGVEGTFKVLNKNSVMYQDLSGSGSETIAHLRENARITVLFQALNGPPRICRLYGTGAWHEYGSPEYHRLVPDDERLPGSRAVVVVSVHKVGTSCGYAVPIYEFQRHRKQLLNHFDNVEAFDSKDPSGISSTKGLRHYWALKNASSVDGLPAMFIGEKYARLWGIDPFGLKPFVQQQQKFWHAVDGVSEYMGLDAKFVIGFFAGAAAVFVSSRLNVFYAN